MAYQDIFIIGATGKVGRTLLQQVINCGDTDSAKHMHPTRIVGVASSECYMYSHSGLDLYKCADFAVKKGVYDKYSSLDDILNHVLAARKNTQDSLVFVDVTASKEIISFHQKVIHKTGFCLVTANKNPLALCSCQTFQELTREPGRYGYRCSVMAGAESVCYLQDLRDVNDLPKRIQGCFSGTLGYICTELDKGRLFSEILREAVHLGYTEPHPRDDLNGFDVAKKLLILVRTAGYMADLSDISITPFVLQEHLSVDNVDLFLDSARKLDDYFSSKVDAAHAKGNVLRYIAGMEAIGAKLHLSVALHEVAKESCLGSLNGTLNKIVVVSEAYPADFPYSVEAPGAGLKITAQNIRRDLLHQINSRRIIG